MSQQVMSKGRKRRLLAGLIVVSLLLLVGGTFLFIYSGVYNVAATEPHARPVEWALRTTMENSIRAHAEGIEVPAGVNLRDRAVAERAIGHYSVACAMCHAAPGEGRAPWMVIYPEPPDLTKKEVVSRWSDAELYWIVKHGIKDTGMLALGPTHKEEDLWAVTAFVRQLPEMSPEEYRAMVERYKAKQQEMKNGGMDHTQHADPMPESKPGGGKKP